MLSWNPHCGHCFYCEQDQPILCESYLAAGAAGGAVRRHARGSACAGEPVHHLMFLGAFAEYCVVPAQSAVKVPAEIPFDRACLIGCGVMTGVGAATRIAKVELRATRVVIGCGAVGLSAVQGARLAGAGRIVAVDIDARKLELARRLGATDTIDAAGDDPAAGDPRTDRRARRRLCVRGRRQRATFRLSAEAVRPGGQIVWLGKVNVNEDVAFRWGSPTPALMSRVTGCCAAGWRPGPTTSASPNGSRGCWTSR